MNRNILLAIIFVVCCCLSVLANAAQLAKMQKIFPTCVARRFSFHNDHIILDPASLHPAQRLYLIYNRNNQAIALEHKHTQLTLRKLPFSAKWRSIITSKHWSAIAIEQPQFDLRCYQMLPGEVKPIDCKQHLSICELTHTPFSSAARGTYWVSENKLLPGLVSQMNQRGITPKVNGHKK